MSEQQKQLEMLITYLMYEHAPIGWTWDWDKPTLHRWGQCNYRTKQLLFNKALFMSHDAKEARHTILHEIAHSLCPIGTHHGALWKQKCVELGIEPRWHHPRAEATQTIPGAKFVGVCPNEHKIFRMRRTKRRQSCGVCNPAFDEQYLIRWAAIL